MDKFANKPETERRDILQEAANRKDVLPIIMEKDFWVCWTLKRLFSNPVLAPYLTFKGGTSLSKAYGLIERFSEDIDLTISRNAPYVADTKSPMEEDISGKERERRIEALKNNTQLFVTKDILRNLKDDIHKTLGKDTDWQLVLDENDKDRQSILFYYPKVFEYTNEIRFQNDKIYKLGFNNDKYEKIDFHSKGYIRPSVKLEFGGRGETEPHSKRPIQPYVAEILPSIFADSTFNVSALAIERTFWEKVTILHALYHGTKLQDRMSRHYYDTYMMAQQNITLPALKNITLLEQVVRNKSLLFRDAKASYETAIIGTLKLKPHKTLLAELAKDYVSMEQMFFGDYPDFNEIMFGLEQLEKKLNQK